jgi:hypothetical protein
MTKKSKHEGDERRFIIMSQAWYGDAAKRGTQSNPNDDEVLLGFYCPDGGTSGEFSIKWRELGNRMVPYLKAFDDSWSALHNFSDVIAALAKLDATNPTVDQVASVLVKCGVKDATPRESPYKPKASDVEAVVTLLNIHLEAFEQIRQLGRDVSNNPNWADGFEFNKGVLNGTKEVTRDIVDELVKSAEMVDVYRTKLRKQLEEHKDPELTAQYNALAYPAQK